MLTLAPYRRSRKFIIGAAVIHGRGYGYAWRGLQLCKGSRDCASWHATFSLRKGWRGVPLAGVDARKRICGGTDRNEERVDRAGALRRRICRGRVLEKFFGARRCRNSYSGHKGKNGRGQDERGSAVRRIHSATGKCQEHWPGSPVVSAVLSAGSWSSRSLGR